MSGREKIERLLKGPESIITQPSGLYKVRFQDCDPFQHLNSAQYLHYLFNAREDHVKQAYDLDIGEMSSEDQGNWYISKIQVAYLLPSFAGELVNIVTRVIHYSVNNLVLEGVILDNKKKTLKALGWSEFTYVHSESGRPKGHPDYIMRFFKEILYREAEVISLDFDTRRSQVRKRIRRQRRELSQELCLTTH